MRVYNYSEARRNFSSVLNQALEEEVIISRRDGSRFRVIPVEDKEAVKSPLSVESIQTEITTSEILSFVKESREQE